MQIINSTLYSENPYQRLLYGHTGGFEPVRGTIDDALDRLKKADSHLLHVHWEEHVIRRSPSAAEAEAMTSYFEQRLAEFTAHGGQILWTVHNEMPHELEHPQHFLRLRNILSRSASRILVHNLASIDVLDQQVGIDRAKIFYLPHPSYLGFYEPEGHTEAAPSSAKSRTVLLFGKLRRYKNVERLLEALALEPQPDFDTQIIGEPLQGEAYAEELVSQYGSLPRVNFDFRRIADKDVPPLLRSARCVVLPYERFLTSGVALLTMTFGTPIVAPDTPQMREVLPKETHSLLYRAGDTHDLRRAIDDVMSCDQISYDALVAANKARARYFHPRRMGRLLGGLMREAIGARAADVYASGSD